MPNWCYNNIEFVGEKENIDKFENFLNEKNGKEWFDYFLPTPKELTEVQSPNRDESSARKLAEKYGYTDWYEWNVGNWGTKWNCDANSITRVDENTLRFTFDSAWSPPIALYEYIEGEEFEITASYLEEGMAFIGRYQDGYDESYNYSDLESLDEIPEDLVEEWNLREQMEDQLEWSDAEDDDMVEALQELKDEYDGLSK